MAAQHTPGPWGYGIRDDSFEMSALCTIHNVPRFATEDGLGQAWAYVSAPKKCFEIDEAENEANGRLMAAAPDMLLAGKHLAVKLAEAYRVAGISPAECQAIRDWMAAAAKAEAR